VAGDMVVAWVLTIPAAALVSASLYGLLSIIF
jgi:phosphate/sulfate permease